MTRTVVFALMLLGMGSANGQDGSSAFIDPFKPSKPVNDKQVNDENKSFFPKLGMPKMPSLPKIPNLNPFAKKQGSPRNATLPTKPNMFQQIGTGTKNFFTKTTHTLMPWTKPKPKKVNGAIVPAFMQNTKTTQKKKSGIQLMNFFQPAKDKKKVNSPGDFFKQERPGFRK